MINEIEIYGTKVTIPVYDGVVEDWGTSIPEDQFWRKRDLPNFFRDVEYDRDGNAILNYEQRKYALEEVRRCKEGFVFMGTKTCFSSKL